MDYLVLLGRVLFGGYFLMNAYNHFKNVEGMSGYAQSKGIPANLAKMAVMGTGVLLGLGGLSFVLGVRTGLGALAIAIFLIGVTFQMHKYWEVTDPMAQMGERINFYKNMALLGATLMTLAVTAWPLSLITLLF